MHGESLKKTLLHNYHSNHNAKLVDFAGWDMPLHYGSQITEHHWVRKEAGIFDVSHMSNILMQGKGTKEMLRRLVCGDVARLSPGQGLYTCMLNHQGGILDDLIIYQLGDEQYLAVVNAATSTQDLDWINNYKSEEILISLQAQHCIFALQGPYAREWFGLLFPKHSRADNLARFACILEDDVFIARTGYTGEDGYELIVPEDKAVDYWEQLVTKFHPCGLGCRDTLRLEAGMSLYGNDLDVEHTPLDSGISWTVHWDDDKRDFIGKKALNDMRQNGIIKEKMVGLILNEAGIMRHGNKVLCSGKEGVITSGSFSPTLNKSIALARIPKEHKNTECYVEIRDKRVPASIAKTPFITKRKKEA